MLPSWLRKTFRKKFLGHGTVAPIQNGLTVEVLEERALLAVAVWDGDGIAAPTNQNPTSLWSDARNWANSYIPQDGDEVIFPAGLDDAHQPPPTIVNGALVYPINSTFDLDGLRISQLRIDDDQYRIDAVTTQTLHLDGRLLVQIPKTLGSLTGLSLIGPQFTTFNPLTGDPLPSNLQIKLTDDASRLNAFENATGNRGVLYIKADLTDFAPGFGNKIQKTGDGGWIVLAGTNTFTGNVTVTQGTLVAASDSALGGAALGTEVTTGASIGVSFGAAVTDPVVISGVGANDITAGGANGQGALVGLNDALVTFGGRTLATAGSWVGGVTLSGDSRIGTTGVALSIDTIGISGSGTLTKVGFADLSLTTRNTYGGNTLITEGSVTIFNDEALSLSPGQNFSTTVSAFASLEVAGGLSVNEVLFLNGVGFYIDGSSRRNGALHLFPTFTSSTATWLGTITLQSDSRIGAQLDSEFLLAGEMFGSSRLTKSDQGNVRIARNNNNFTGSTTVDLGTLEIADALALGRSGTVTVNSVPGAQATVGTLQIEGTYTFTRPLVINGIGFASAGAIDVVAGSDITIPTTSSVTLASDTSLQVEAGANLRLNARVTNPTGTASSLEKTGTGTLFLAGANNYGGSTTLSEGVTVLQNAAGLGTVSTATSTRVVAGAALLLATPMTLAEELVLSGTGFTGTDGVLQVGTPTNATPLAVVATGRISLIGQNTTRADVFVAPNAILNFSNVVGGSDAALHKTGAGELQFTGAANNTYVTPTFVDNGTLTLAKSPGLIALAGQVFVGTDTGANNSAVLKYGTSNQVPETVGVGTPLVVTVNATGQVNLNGNNETFGGLTLVGGEVATGAGLLTLDSEVRTLGSPDPSRLVGNVTLGGVTRRFSSLSLPGMKFFASEDPVQFGQSVTLTAEMTGVLNGPTVNGQVEFFDGTTSLGTGFVNPFTGRATLTTSSLTAGTHTITATYTDTSFEPLYGERTIALPNILDVVGAPSRQILSSNTNPVAPGRDQSFTYIVTRTVNTNPLPTGFVEFFADDTSDLAPRFSIGFAAVQSSGNATLTLDDFFNFRLPVGSYTISADYSGDAAYAAGSATLGAPQVVVDSPVLRLTSSANSSRVGQNVTFTFAATPGGVGSPVPTGNADFYDGATLLMSVPLATVMGVGTATYSTNALTAGTKAITVQYSGDSFYEAQTLTLLGGQVVVNNPTLLVSSSANPSRPGEAVTFTFTVNNAAATGFATFRNNGTPLGGAVPVVGGVAQFTTALLPRSTATINNVIDVVYTGGGGSAGGTIALAPAQIVSNQLGVSLSSSANPSLFGQNVTFTFLATPQDAVNDPAPTGTVTFFDGTTQIGAAVPLVFVPDPFPATTGVYRAAVTTTAPLAFGPHQITAVYTGDARYEATTVRLAVAPQPQQLVTAAPSIQLTTTDPTVDVSLGPVTVTYTAVVASQPTTPGPGGTGVTVTFFDNGVMIGTPQTLTGVGLTQTVSVSQIYSTPGTHVITVSYTGNTFYQARTVTMSPNQTVTALPVVPPDTTVVPVFATLDVSAPLTGAPLAGVRAVGSGETILNRVNAYTGDTTIASGVVRLGVSNALPDTALTIDFTGALDVNNQIDAVASLSGSGPLALGSGRLTTLDNTSQVYSGVITGTTGGLTKFGTGSLTLLGNSPGYDGTSVVAGGTLFVNANQSAADVLVAAGGTLGGNGQVGGITVNAGGMLSPGATVGTSTANLNANGPVTFAANSLFVVNAATTTPGSGYDRVTTPGAATLNGATLSFNPTFNPGIGASFGVLRAASVAGDFNGLPDGTQVTIGNRVYQVQYVRTGVNAGVNLNVVAFASTATLATSPNPSLPGQPVTLTVTITPTLGTDPRPLGNVQFYVDGAAFGGVQTLSGGATGPGTATITTNPTPGNPLYLATGPHTITATFTHQTVPTVSNYADRTQAELMAMQLVTAPSTTTLTALQGPVVFGDAVSFQARVTTLPGLPAATGTFTFVNAATNAVLGSVAFTGGATNFTPAAFPVGTTQVQVIYSGDSFYRASASLAVAQVVDHRNFIVVGSDAGPVATVQVYDPRLPGGSPPVKEFQPFDQYTLGVKVATGDVNGDGVVDVIVSAGAGAPGGHVKVFDGVTLNLISSFLTFPGYTGGVNIAAGDVDGDGFADIVVGTAIANDHVKAFSGRALLATSDPNSSTLMSFFAYGGGNPVGVTVGTGDVDGDGRADVITGSATFAGHVKAFQALTQAQIGSYFAYGQGYLGGIFVAGGDLDGDGKAEVITGATNAPHVKALKADSGAEVASFFAYANPNVGVRVGAIDRNGDRLADILTGSGSDPLVKVFSGLDPTQLIDAFLANPTGRPPSTSGVFVGGNTK